jgi:uncharacterized protein YchJ
MSSGRYQGLTVCTQQCQDHAYSVYEFAAYILYQGLTNVTMINMNSDNYSFYMNIKNVWGMIDAEHNPAGS